MTLPNKKLTNENAGLFIHSIYQFKMASYEKVVELFNKVELKDKQKEILDSILGKLSFLLDMGSLFPTRCLFLR